MRNLSQGKRTFQTPDQFGRHLNVPVCRVPPETVSRKANISSVLQWTIKYSSTLFLDQRRTLATAFLKPPASRIRPDERGLFLVISRKSLRNFPQSERRHLSIVASLLRVYLLLNS